MSRRRVLSQKAPVVIPPASDIALYDKTTGKEIVIRGLSYNATDYPVDRFVPVGVVVIPKEHSLVLYPESHECYGKDIIMSLKYMRCDTPDTGGASQQIYWGYWVYDFTIPNCPKAAVVANSEAEEESTESVIWPSGEFGEYCYLPSTKFHGPESKAAPKTYYNSTSNLCPSPYLWKNGKWGSNPAFYNCPATCAQTDRDGKGNTEVILAQATGQADWKTANSITDSCDSGCYPAACCCWRYHLDGIDNQGDWYFPAFGELCYIMPFFNEHNNAMTRINNVFGSASVVLDTGGHHWSSSECNPDSHDQVWFVGADSGKVSNSIKDSGGYVRAFRPVHG